MRALIVAALTLGSVALGAGPATAAGGLAVSSDGAHFGATLTSQLFAGGGSLVPSESRSGRFWVRNDSAEIAYLRLALLGAHSSNDSYASALSLRVAVDGVQGSRVRFSSTRPCTSLIAPTIVQPGQAVRVDAVLSLGDLSGSVAQNEDARLAMKASLSDAPPSSDRGDECALAGLTVPVVVPTRSTPTPQSTSTRAPAITSPFINSNGQFGRWWNLWPLVGFAVGAVGFMVIAGRRRRRQDEGEEEATA